MPLFEVTEHDVSSVKQTNFDSEKVLQNLVERNLETIFNCRFVASEFSTGANHAGRIDTLALSEGDYSAVSKAGGMKGCRAMELRIAEMTLQPCLRTVEM